MEAQITYLSDSINHGQVSQAHSPEEVKHLGDAGTGWNSVGTRVHVGGDILGKQKGAPVNESESSAWLSSVSVG